MEGGGSWYRYQGEPSSYDRYANEQVNCGPTSVAMAIQHSTSVSVPIRDIRAFIGKPNRYTYHSDLTRALTHWGVDYRSNIVDAASIRAALSRGHIVVAALRMGAISPGVDVEGASADPTLRTGRYSSFGGNHWIVVKGVSPDGRYFVVYDGNVWSSPQNHTYWYSDGTPKGLDRYYLASQVEAGMYAFGTTGSKGVEIAKPRRPRMESGQRLQARVTYYTLSPQETGKRPTEPGWAIMYNGKRVHWGAVAVDPSYIALGTRMRIEGWRDTVFVAEDTGSAVKGYHVDVYWPGTRQEALEHNDTLGGVREVTILGQAPAFTDTATGTPPHDTSVRVVGDAGHTKRWVRLKLRARGAVGMMISNHPLFTDAFEEPYTQNREWTLEGVDGVKRVYVRYKAESGAWSEAVSVVVRLGEQPPVGTVTLAPDPRIALSAGLGGSVLPAIGSKPEVIGHPLYRPLGANRLDNASFEAWAGGIPAGWDSQLREQAYRAYEPDTNAYHGNLGLRSESGQSVSALTQMVSLKPLTRYTLSAWARGERGKLSLQERETQGSTSRALSGHGVQTHRGEGWRRARVSFVTAANTTDGVVRLAGGGVVWDAVQLEEGETPSEFGCDGVLLEGGATNHIANPSLERGAEGWGGFNAYVEVSSSPRYARYGTKALLVSKEKAGRAATVTGAELTPGVRYTYSVYARLSSGGRIDNEVMGGWMYEGSSRLGAVEDLEFTEKNRPRMVWEAVGGGWYRGSYSFVAEARRGLYGVASSERVRVGEEYYLDGAQLEEGGHTTSYLDGSLGEGYKWSGQGAHREGVGLSYPSGVGSRGTVVFWARPEGEAAEGAAVLELGSVRVEVRGGVLVARAVGKVVGVAPWSGVEARAYAISWDTERVRLYVEGELVGERRSTAPEAGTQLRLGGGVEESPNAVVGDVSVWRSALGESELRYLREHAPLDPGLERVRARSTRVATGAMDASGGRIGIEWSEDGKEWHEWERVQGLHEWDLGEGEGTKTVWVRYTDSDGNWLVYADKVQLDTTQAGAVTPYGESRSMSPSPRRHRAAKHTTTPVEVGGIGLSRAEWERLHGQAVEEVGGFVSYEHGKYVVAFLDGRVRYIERKYHREVSLDTARRVAKGLLPADAVLVRAGKPRAERVLELYGSGYLKSRFISSGENADPWVRGERGSSSVLYRIEAGQVVSVIVAVGTIS